MPGKKSSARKRTLLLPAPPQAFAAGATNSTQCRSSDEDKQLAGAIAASRTRGYQNDSYSASLTQALEFSRATAAAEAEEAEAIRLAVDASLAEASQKTLGLGLKSLPVDGFRSELIADLGRVTLGLVADREDAPCTRKVPVAVQAAAVDAPARHSLKVSHENDTRRLPCTQNASVAVAAAAVDAPVRHILKVSYKNDMRRLRADWNFTAPAPQVLSIIQAAVEEGFALSKDSAAPTAFSLKYQDEEGDLCTLVPETLTDFLDTEKLRGSFHGLLGSTLKITVEEQTKSVDTLEDFSFATPPTTPRADGGPTIEDDYDSLWSLVEADA